MGGGFFKGRGVGSLIVAVYLLIGMTAPLAEARAKEDCIRALRAASLSSERNIKNIESLRIASYNLLNFDLTLKASHQILGVAKAIGEIKPDVIAVQEVYDTRDLEKFVRQYLNDEYQVFVFPGNDPRGIKVGLLVRRDLPFEVELRSHAKISHSNSKDLSIEPVFSRDFGALILYSRQTSDLPRLPLLAVFSTHFKSKRDRPHDPGSHLKRTAQGETSADIVNDLRNEFLQKHGYDLPIIIGGDFNAPLHEGEFDSILNIGFENSLNYSKIPLTEEEKATHSYFSGGEAEYSQLDYLLSSPALLKYIVDSQVYRYKNESGQPIGLPRDSTERNLDPSDHMPIYMDIKFSELFLLIQRQLLKVKNEAA
jgi:exonuclease III